MKIYIRLLKEVRNMYKFHELPQAVQIDIIKGKLLDIYRQGLIRELAIDILYKQNNIVYQCENELYTLDGTFIKEVE
nr:MAG TPA: hypothetical protein [Caudoviricetes sp.]